MAVESTAGVYTVGGVGTSPWSRFFATDPVTRTSLNGAPLRRSGRALSFIHKSIPEYFAACAMFDDVLRIAVAVALAGQEAVGGDIERVGGLNTEEEERRGQGGPGQEGHHTALGAAVLTALVPSQPLARVHVGD
jgi:hypothetical protein